MHTLTESVGASARPPSPGVGSNLFELSRDRGIATRVALMRKKRETNVSFRFIP